MKRLMAALALSAMAVLPAACGRDGDATRSEDIGSAPVVPAQGPVAPDPAVPPASSVGPVAADASTSLEATGGAPTFAVLYPGAALDAPAVTASGPAGPGGLVTYTIDADPDTVIAFYRTRAEEAGLSSVMAMNQGEARAYGAAKSGTGATLQVVASPTDAGETSVQLSWSAGQ